MSLMEMFKANLKLSFNMSNQIPTGNVNKVWYLTLKSYPYFRE